MANVVLLDAGYPSVDGFGGADIGIRPVPSPLYVRLQSDGGAPIPGDIRPLAPQYYGQINVTADAVGGIPDGSTIVVNGVTFTARTTPTEQTDVYAVPPAPSTAQYQLFVDSLADAINSNAALSWYLEASEAFIFVPRCVIRAKLPGPTYQPTIVPAAYLLQDTTVVATSPGRYADLADKDYKAYIRVLVFDRDTQWPQAATPFVAPYLVAEVSAPFDPLNVAAVDVRNYVQPFLSPVLPPATPFSYYRHPTAIRRVRIEYGEEYSGGIAGDTDDTTIRRYPIGSKEIYVGMGAMPLYDRPVEFAHRTTQMVWNGSSYDYNSVLPCTDAPTYMRIKRASDIPYPVSAYVGFDVDRTSPSATLSRTVEYIFFDGSSLTVGPLVVGTVSNAGLYTFDLGYTALDIPTIEASEGKEVMEAVVSLHIRRTGEPLDDLFVVSLAIDQNVEPDEYYGLLWRNRYGVYECLHMEGTRNTTRRYNATNHAATIGPLSGPSLDKGNRATYAVEQIDSLTLLTGWYEREVIDDYIAQIGASDSLSVLTEWQGEAYWRLYTLDTASVNSDTRNQLFQASFTLQSAHTINTIRR